MRATSPFPATSYALSKVASEGIAEQVTRWSGIPFTGLRISNIMGPATMREFPSFWTDPHLRSGTCGATSTSGTSPPPAALALRLTRRRPARHHRRGRHRHEPSVTRAARRGLPPCPRLPGSWAEFGTLLAIGRARQLPRLPAPVLLARPPDREVRKTIYHRERAFTRDSGAAEAAAADEHHAGVEALLWVAAAHAEGGARKHSGAGAGRRGRLGC